MGSGLGNIHPAGQTDRCSERPQSALWEEHFKLVDSRIVDSIGWDGKGVARVRAKLGACGCTSFSGPPLGQRADV